MIVYYNPLNYSITGLSHKLLDNTVDPWIDTVDPLALNIFLGREKSLNYIIVPLLSDNTKGIIKQKMLGNSVIPKDEKVYKIPFLNTESNFTVTQDTANCIIKIDMQSDAITWWKESKKKIHLVACMPNDPYFPLWSQVLDPTQFNSGDRYHYTGTHDFNLYTMKIFGTYSHIKK
jgi:hypothetical protein